MLVLKIECIIGVWRDGKCGRKWWTYYSLHMIEALEFFFFLGSKGVKLIKKKLKIWGGFLRKGKSVREKNGGGLVVGLSDGRQWHSLRVSETQWVWERRVREMGWGGWVKWEGVGSVYKFIHIYIYIYIFGNFTFNRVRVGFESMFRVSFNKTWTRFGFYFKYSNPTRLFHGSRKTRPLRGGWGRAGYPRVMYFLPYLIENPIDDVFRLKTVTWSMSQLYHCFVMFTSRCSSTTAMWSWKFGCCYNKQ